jgi:hypothetical protein
LFFLYELYHFITLVVAERTKKKLAAAPVSAAAPMNNYAVLTDDDAELPF